MNHKLVKAVVTLKARDYASFEDLCIDTSVEINDLEFITLDQAEPEQLELPNISQPVKKQVRKKRKKAVRVTKDHVIEVTAYNAAKPHIPQNRIATNLGISLGASTVNAILRGAYDHLL